MSRIDTSSNRQFIAGLLILLAAAMAFGRICASSRVYEPELSRDEDDPGDRRGKWPVKRPAPMPTFSSNDRSRWATVRALVDHGTFVIGRRDQKVVVCSAVALVSAGDPIETATLAAVGYQARTKADSGIIFEDGWQSLDKVLNPATMEYYSSKPPLLSTLVAGLYWVLQWLTGWTLRAEPFAVVRTILVLVNLVPFVIYLRLLVRLLERLGAREWTNIVVLSAACFATLVTPFLITLNNHTLGTFCTLFAIYPVLRWLRLPGWLGGTAATPSAGAPPFWTLAVSGLAAGFLVTNELPALAFAVGLGALLALRWPLRTLVVYVPALVVPIAALLAINYVAMGEGSLAYSKFGGPWYEYEGSYWHKPPPGQMKYGIDWARYHESRATYAFHVLLGHHGWFSLTPLWFLAAAGMGLALWSAVRRRADGGSTVPEPGSDRDGWRALMVLTAAVSAAVIGYYLFQSDNYGGFTSGLRWLMWLTPLWLLAMVPVLDWLERGRWGRGLVYVLLAWSVFSMSYPAWNPWRHPWLYNLLDSEGGIPYLGEKRGR